MTKHSPEFESLDQMADATAAGLAQAAAAAAYELFCDEQFRRLAGFERLSQVEHDRIFNELVLAFLVLIMLLLEAPDLRVAPESQDYLNGLNKRIPKAYVDHLKTLGVKTNYLRDWEKLITMRYEEYARDKHGVRRRCRLSRQRKGWIWMVFRRSNCSCRFKPLRLAATTTSAAARPMGKMTCSN